MSNREDIRNKVFSSKNFKRKEIELFGEKVEVKQPSIGELTNLAKLNTSEKNQIIMLMIDFCFVPGTNDKVFTAEDYEGLCQIPSGTWVNDFQEAWISLSGLNIEEAGKN